LPHHALVSVLFLGSRLLSPREHYYGISRSAVLDPP